MDQRTGKFTISYADAGIEAASIEKEAIRIGRLRSSDVFLDHSAVSRLHAGINFLDSTYFLINLSTSNVLTLNGRPLAPRTTDVLSNGDIVQIGPFAIEIIRFEDELTLKIQPPLAARIPSFTPEQFKRLSAESSSVKTETNDVLKVFWEKRTRDKEDWGTRLRPSEKPQPGKAAINWKPTRDLRRPWRFGLFVWSFVVIGALGVFAFMQYPQVYVSKPLASPHIGKIENSQIAAMANGNSCTTCHTPNEPIENACIRCHEASQFHSSNTRAHQEAGITCTVCHQQHEGEEFDMTASAIQNCAQCHSDTNPKTYNGKGVRTAHGGSYGYPVENGVWSWKGVYREIADAIPEINASATGDADDQGRISRHFHSIHVGRLKIPEGIKGDSRGLISCSSCHESFDPIDRSTPRQTCAACHTISADSQGRDARFAAGSANCISCHVQHPYSGNRWNEFLTDSALKRRRDAVEIQIKALESK